MNSTVKNHQANYLINKIFLTFQSVYPNSETSQYNTHNLQEIRQIYQPIVRKMRPMPKELLEANPEIAQIFE